MKRFLKYALLALSCTLLLASCNENKRKKALLPNISGKAGEVIVVIDRTEWEGAMGVILRDSLAQDCPFLPQREPMYNLVDVIPSGFTTMFQMHRNIIIVNINNAVTEPGVVYLSDKWAKPQCVIQISAIDTASAVQLFIENCSKIMATLQTAERDRAIANARKYEEKSFVPVVNNLLGASVNFPTGYRLKKNTSDFLWITYEPQQIQQSVLLFKYPVRENENMMSKESIIKNTNAILKDNVPGMFDNSYMILSTFANPSIEYLKYKGKDFAELRGFWEVQNDFMGGPYVQHVYYSKDGKEMISLLGFVYAPKCDKRLYLRQVESIIYSFEWLPEKTE